MTRRFSEQTMHHVRNQIPIRYVIETLLAIKTETVQGRFRFQCPICGGRHTVIQEKTNLSRCFQCEKNFNVIDLCIQGKGMTFVETIHFLLKHQTAPLTLGSDSVQENRIRHAHPQNRTLKEPVPIKNIIGQIIDNAFSPSPKNKNSLSSLLTHQIQSDIKELEEALIHLSQIVQRLKTTLEQR